ncbi:hypothetical protein ZWY2020_049908 [Hordeum vulgare]|nr:hypothetical protein ZWY2020_049908 [Hordeum vulgare]
MSRLAAAACRALPDPRSGGQRGGEDDDRAVLHCRLVRGAARLPLYADMKVSEVAALFGADPAALLAANALDFASPAPPTGSCGLLLRVPTCCACADGVRKSVSVRYAARPADTLATVADVVFAGLAC